MKKVLSIALLASLILSMATGCGGGNSAGSDAKTSGEAKGVTVGEPFGSAEKPVAVSIVLKDVLPTEEGTMQLEKAIEEGMAAKKQFIDLKFLEAPSGTYGEALPIAVRTGQISPDIIYFQNGDLPLANEGLLEDFTQYIEKSVNVKNLMQDQNKEKMKNYPYLLWLAAPRITLPTIRGDYAEKYPSVKAAIENPTIENYEAMFKELVSSGAAKYAITSDGSMKRFEPMFNYAFGVTSSFMKKDGKYVSSMVTEEEKNKLAFYAKLYSEGLIDPEYLTNKWDVMEQKFYEGDAAIIAGTGGATTQIYNDKMTQTNGAGAELLVLSPAKGVKQGFSVDVTKESRGYAINAKSVVKNEAFAVLEFMASPEGRVIDKIGVKGIHYNINADGKYELTDKFPEWWSRVWETYYNFPKEIEFVKEPMSTPHKKSLEMIDTYYNKDINVIFPDELQPKWDALTSLYKEYSVDIITGKKPITAFDEMVAKWGEMGGKDIDSYVNEHIKE